MTGETWRCPSCRDTTAPMGMCQRCGIFGLRYGEAGSRGLDVERLGRAVRAVRWAGVPIEDRDEPGGWYVKEEERFVAAIAREYAALADTQETTDG